MSFLCIGHRGASGHAPENTLLAFEKAIEMGCPWVELDVYAVENVLLVMHDEELERTTNGQGLVVESDLTYLRSLNAGRGQQIPTLSEVIRLIDHRAVINIELKGPDTADPVNRLLRHFLHVGWQADEFLLSSFHYRELSKTSVDFRRGVLFGRKSRDYFKKTHQLNAYSINLSRRIVDENTVREAHQQGLKVFVYTVDETAEMEKLEAMGVDGVFTNFPDRFPW